MATQDKIMSLESLAQHLAHVRQRELKIVMCHGVFDLLHLGHMRYFDQAKKYGDLLVVTLTPDRFVNKGSHRPIFSEAQRAEAIAALSAVDYIAINLWPTATETIRLLKPDVYCKGGEFRDMKGELPAGLQSEIDASGEVGTEIRYTDDNLLSSSNLINTYLSPFSPETQEWLKTFRDLHAVDEVIGLLSRASKLRVLVIGEAIIDEYIFCDGLGKSTKDPILAFLYRSKERYAGGSLAVANHVAGFCEEVNLVSLIGETESHEDFMKGSLLPNVQTTLVSWRGAPTIQKLRFVDTHTGARTFELYTMEDRPLDSETETDLLRTIDALVGEYDVVMAADYGHGMLTPAGVQKLCESARFLAVNTQANAGNRGFNAISKYPRADYVCLAMHEVALETRMRHAHWRELVYEVIQRIDCPRFTVTRGKEGSIHYTSGCDFVEVPALATQIKDRVGAGDALFAVTSLLAAQNAPWDIVGFLGNLAGAQMVADLGNRVKVNIDSMSRHIISLMK